MNYLRLHPDQRLSPREIGEALREEDVSLSAVYRNLAELEAEGKVRRTGQGDAHEAFYQYIDAEECRGCLHLNCRRCGRTFHMKAEGADRLLDVVAKTEGFALDTAETVLYGTCQDCRQESESPSTTE